MGELEHFILLAILKLGPDAYAINIRQALHDAGSKLVTRGALYRALDRLEEKRFVRWLDVPGAPERGGHTRRRFSLTADGLRHVRARRQVLLELWAGSEASLRR
jgi:DNA-binding PadR family transcriptional regulator